MYDLIVDRKRRRYENEAISGVRLINIKIDVVRSTIQITSFRGIYVKYEKI